MQSDIQAQKKMTKEIDVLQADLQRWKERKDLSVQAMNARTSLHFFSILCMILRDGLKREHG